MQDQLVNFLNIFKFTNVVFTTKNKRLTNCFTTKIFQVFYILFYYFLFLEWFYDRTQTQELKENSTGF